MSLAQNLRPETRRLSPKLAKPLPTIGLDLLYAVVLGEAHLRQMLKGRALLGTLRRSSA